MAEQCQAYAHRYVGKGKDRRLYEGPCVLPERGHDGDHLPASLAAEQQHAIAFNQGLAAATAVVALWLDAPDNDVTESRRTLLLEALAKEIK